MMRDLFIRNGPHHYPVVQTYIAYVVYFSMLGLGWVFYGWPVMAWRGWGRAFTWSDR